jgi:hypothetical protein
MCYDRVMLLVRSGGFGGVGGRGVGVDGEGFFVLAGLSAAGRIEVNRVYHIDRGYGWNDEKFNGLGAAIECVKA